MRGEEEEKCGGDFFFVLERFFSLLRGRGIVRTMRGTSVAFLVLSSALMKVCRLE